MYLFDVLLYRLAKIIFCFVNTQVRFAVNSHNAFFVQCSILLCQFLLYFKDFNLGLGNDLVFYLQNFDLLFLVRNSAFAANKSLFAVRNSMLSFYGVSV